MTSTHRYPPPPPNSQNDFRLPSLKDLNFYRPSGAQPALPPSQQQDQPNIQPEQPPHPTRHPVAWSRSAYQPAQLATPTAHQQYTPASHEVPPKVEYTPKQENIPYAHPGVPVSVQTNSTSASMLPQRNEDPTHSPNQPKRQRTAPSAASRDTRPSHPSVYPHPQYQSYPQGSQPPSASQYHSVAPGLPPTPSHATHPAPSSHEQIHHPSHPMQVTTHQGYAYPAYVQPRQTLLHPPNSSQISQHNHSNPYPSSAPPPAHSPQPQGPWTQSHTQQQPPPQFQQQPPPPPQHPQHNPHPGHAPSHHHHHQHQPQVPISAPSNQPVPAHHHHQQQPPPPPGPPANPQTPQQIHPPVQYHAHQQQYQNQYPHPPQHQQQQHQQAPASFVRPTAINPSSLENRSTYPVAEPPRVSSVHNDAMSEITDHCNILYSFANQYVTLQQSNPHAQPPPAELEEMSQRALKVVRLLDDFRRICIPESAQLQTSPTASALASNSVAPMETDSPGPGESSRPPKRPWEDSQEDGVPAGDAAGFQDQFPANPSPDPRNQSTAEQDMELIRNKRATSTAIANGSSGQPKSKYRKRSMGQRASPPGKCHSCNIRETPEWRRGPDGARTLCNACGLHYAKLMRKQNKTAGNGDTPHIDLETLRASTRAADIAEKGRSTSLKQVESSSSSSKTNNKNQQNSSDTNAEASTSGTATPAPSQTHQGSFQLVNMMAPPPQEHHPSQNHGHGHPPIPSASSSTVPTPMPDSRPTSQHTSTPQMHPPQLPSIAPSHHPHPHPLHPPHPPWPTTAATTGPAAAASGAVSASSTAPGRNGASGGPVNGPSFGNPPSQSPVDFIRRQYSLPTRIGNQQHQPSSR